MDAAFNSQMFDDAIVAEIARHGVVRKFPIKTILIHEGDVSDSFFVILDGGVRVYRTDEAGRTVTLGFLGRGQCFGELALAGGQRDASVETMEETRCAIVPGTHLRALTLTTPAVAIFLVDVLIARVRDLSSTVKSLALENVYQRIARLLTESADFVEGEWVVRARLTHREIAECIGSSREMVSRVLKELTSGGYVRVEDASITILKKLPQGW